MTGLLFATRHSPLSHEDFHPRRLFRHAAHAAVFPQARRLRGHGLERSRAGYDAVGRATEGYRSAGADSRAHPDSRAAPRAAAQTEADQPAQRLSPYRYRCLHAARHCRLVEPARRYAVLCRRGIDLGSDSRLDAPYSAADRRPQSGASGKSASARRCAARRSGFTATAASAASSPATAGRSA